MIRIFNNWLTILFLLSIIALGSALIAEYFFSLMPCKMCIKQRYPYYFIILIIPIFYFFRKIQSIWLQTMNQLAILYGLFYSVWHVGIEQKIFNGPESCSGIKSVANSLKDLKDQIANQPVVNCSEVSWVIFGISAATINSVLLLLILVFNSIFIVRNLSWSKRN